MLGYNQPRATEVRKQRIYSSSVSDLSRSGSGSGWITDIRQKHSLGVIPVYRRVEQNEKSQITKDF